MNKMNLPPLQSGPTVWYGPDMLKKSNEWQIHLSPSEILELEYAAEQFISSGLGIGLMNHELFPLPTLGPKMKSLREVLIQERGFFLMKVNIEEGSKMAREYLSK